METPSKREKAFALYDQGFIPVSPEVKALGLKGSTRYNYFYDWQKQGGKTQAISQAKLSSGKVPSELTMVTLKEEVKGDEEEVKGDEEEVEGDGLDSIVPGDELEPEKPGGNGGKPKDGKKPPTMIAGQGLTFAITISTKTLMLYQIAAAQQEEKLELGDFIDTCVEDTYLGRGLDLGLVRTGGNDG